MPSSYTQNYQLSQWEADDQVQRTDFNSDNAKIDSAIASKVSIITGTYTGNMAESQFINLNCQPKAVIVMGTSGMTNANGYIWGGLAFTDHPVSGGAVEIVSNGFMVRYKNGSAVNTNTNASYYYIAFI